MWFSSVPLRALGPPGHPPAPPGRAIPHAPRAVRVPLQFLLRGGSAEWGDPGGASDAPHRLPLARPATPNDVLRPAGHGGDLGQRDILPQPLRCPPPPCLLT
jgi:hypothetical protein